MNKSIQNLKIKNTELLDDMFPDKSIVVVEPPKGLPYTPNMIIWRNILLYGGQGSGKSETVRGLVEEAVERYGEENVNVLEVKAGMIEHAYQYLNDKPIQIVFADDMTLVPQAKDSIHKFFRIRHHFMEQGSRHSGYILTIMGIHRYHGIPPELRTEFDFFLCRSYPTDKYDKDFFKNFYNQTNIEGLKYISEHKLRDRDLFGYTLVGTRVGKEGWLKLGMSKKSYFNTVTAEGELEPYNAPKVPAVPNEAPQDPKEPTKSTETYHIEESRMRTRILTWNQWFNRTLPIIVVSNVVGLITAVGFATQFGGWKATVLGYLCGLGMILLIKSLDDPQFLNRKRREEYRVIRPIHARVTEQLDDKGVVIKKQIEEIEKEQEAARLEEEEYTIQEEEEEAEMLAPFKY